jgi:hypothetical protein
MNKDFDKKFEDLAWAKMSALLDREMPVAEKRRRRFLFWFWWVLGGLVAAGGLWFMTQKRAIPTLQPSLGSKPIVSTEPPLYESQNATGKTEKSLSKPAPFVFDSNPQTTRSEAYSETTKPSNLIDNQVLTKKFFEQKTGVAQTPPTKLFEATEQPTSPPSETKPLLTEPNKPNDQSLPIKPLETNAMAENAQTEVAKRDFTDFDFLKGRDLVYLTWDEKAGLTVLDSLNQSGINPKTTVALSPFVPTKKGDFKWRFGLTAGGGHTEGVKKWNGYMAGMFLERKWAKRWAIRTGLNYRLVNRISDSLGLTKLATIENITTSGSTPTNFSLVKGELVYLRNTHYLELPLWVDFAFSRRWHSALGVKMAYLLGHNTHSSQLTRLYMAPEELKDIHSGRTYFHYDTNASGLSSSPVAPLAVGLQNFDIALMGRIQYFPIKNLSLDMTYDWGMRGILSTRQTRMETQAGKNNTVVDMINSQLGIGRVYNRFLGAGISYYF